MKKELRKNKKILLVLLLLSITLGYALLNATLTINGSSKIEAQNWDIHWNNVQVTTGSVSIGTGDKAAVITPNDTTEVTFEVTLDKPGDFYEFTVDAVNAGTVDAMVDSVVSTYKIGEGETTTITSNNLPSYLTYSATYSDNKPILQKHYLKANTTENYKVRIEYKKDITASNLPSTDQSIAFSFTVNYKQANDTAISITHTQSKVPVTGTIYWALQDNNNDGDYEKLVISDHEVTGSDGYQGSFAGDTVFNDYAEVPWNFSDYPGEDCYKVEEVKIKGTVAPTSTAYWFSGVGSGSEILEGNLNDLNVSNVTDMSEMFDGAGRNATTFNLDLSGWDTSNVTNMSKMFYRAGGNAAIWDIGDISRWDTSNVTNMSYMFSDAGRNATTFNLNLSGWDASNVTNMSYMFSDAGRNATTFNLNLSGWNTSKVTDMSEMFAAAGASATTFELNLSGWDTSNVTNMSSMFYSAGSNATTWSITIPSTNGGGINNTTTQLYGVDTSTYYKLYDKQYTLA